MKKIILLIAFTFLSAHAVNCIDVLKTNSISFQYQEYKADSGLTLNIDSDYAYLSSINLKRPNDDSLVVTNCLGEECESIFIKYETFKDESKNIDTTNTYYNGTLASTSIYYKDLDSIVDFSFSYSTDPDVPPDTEDIDLTFIRNDTLFNSWLFKDKSGTINVEEEIYIAFDPETNKCYEYETGSEDPTMEYYIETTPTGFIAYSTSLQFDITGKMYYSLKEGTTLIRKVAPAAKPKQFRFFDLKGRPVNNSNKANHQFLIAK